MAWEEDKKQQAIEMYTVEEPTPETSMEIVKLVAEELNESPNGVRMILTRAGVYVKKNPSVGNSSGKTGRVSKAECHQMLVDAVSSMAGIKIEVDRLGIDFILSSTQKAWGLPAGFSICSVSSRLLDISETIKNKGYFVINVLRVIKK